MFLSSAAAATPAGVPSSGSVMLTNIIPFLLMGVVFYFLLIRPQQQQRKRHLEMVSNVKRGDTVLTAGGILGKVIKAPEGDECTVEIAEGVQVAVVKQTLTDVRPKGQMAKPANDAPPKPTRPSKKRA